MLCRIPDLRRNIFTPTKAVNIEPSGRSSCSLRRESMFRCHRRRRPGETARKNRSSVASKSSSAIQIDLPHCPNSSRQFTARLHITTTNESILGSEPRRENSERGGNQSNKRFSKNFNRRKTYPAQPPPNPHRKLPTPAHSPGAVRLAALWTAMDNLPPPQNQTGDEGLSEKRGT